MPYKIKYPGFTLIELLVVISIIAMLTGILIPSLRKVKSAAKRTACLANLRAAAVAFRMYLHDNSSCMPPAARYPSLGLNDKKPISEFLLPFLEAPKALLCPGDNGHQRPDYTQKYFETEGSSYEYWEEIGGTRVGTGFLTDKVVFNKDRVHERDVQVLYDYNNFHGDKGKQGSVNYLYADGHIGDRDSH